VIFLKNDKIAILTKFEKNVILLIALSANMGVKNFYKNMISQLRNVQAK